MNILIILNFVDLEQEIILTMDFTSAELDITVDRDKNPVGLKLVKIAL